MNVSLLVIIKFSLVLATHQTQNPSLVIIILQSRFHQSEVTSILSQTQFGPRSQMYNQTHYKLFISNNLLDYLGQLFDILTFYNISIFINFVFFYLSFFSKFLFPVLTTISYSLLSCFFFFFQQLPFIVFCLFLIYILLSFIISILISSFTYTFLSFTFLLFFNLLVFYSTFN